MDRTEDLVDETLEWSEAGVNSVDLNRVPGATWLRSLLEAVLSLFQGSRLQLHLLSLTLLLERRSSSLVSLLPAGHTSRLNIR